MQLVLLLAERGCRGGGVDPLDAGLHGADRIARQLANRGVATATIHSNRSQNQRLRALKDFKAGAVRVLVATDIAARGIDVDGISHVVNYDFPMHSEDYVHRIGRTGRAHAIGDAISFVTNEDRGELRALEKFIGRGILRKHAEGFVAPPPGSAQQEQRRQPQQQQRRSHGSSGQGARPQQPGGNPGEKAAQPRPRGFRTRRWR